MTRHSLALAALVVLVAFASGANAAPFTPGNLAIYRAGDGGAAVSNAATAVFVDEYTPAGTFVQSISMPTTVNGVQRRFALQGTAALEGLINRSTDGQYLLLTGYDVDLGTATPAETLASNVNRVVGRIDVSGTVDTSTVLTDLDNGADLSPTQSGSPRSAISSNGIDIWVTGAEGGVRYTTFANTGPSTQINADITNLRHVDIFGGQLYISTMSGSAVRIGTVGTGIPTTSGQSTTSLPGVPGTGSPNPSPVQFFMADLSNTVDGVDTLYVADDRAQASGGGLFKYSLVEGTWVASGSIAGVQTPPVSVLRGLTGIVDGSNVTLYATRNSNQLLSFTDTSGHNGMLIGSATLLATAPTNTRFLGLDFVPVTAPPDFNGDYNENGIVDAADYVLWRKTLTQNVPNGTGADGNNNGVIDDEDYTIWRANFGKNAPLGAAAGAAAAVPEPATIGLLALAALAFVGAICRRRTRMK
jgi:hypothetical protein